MSGDMNIILSLLVACFVHVVMGTAKHRHLCAQSATTAGSCHTCVCDEQRIFRCNGTAECNKKTIKKEKAAGKKECEPEMIYNHENLYCTCDEHGRWRSVNCRQIFRYMALQNVSKEIGKFGGVILTHENFKPEIEEGDPCVSGEDYKVDCNVCRCGPHNSLVCTKHACVGRSGNNGSDTLQIKEGDSCVPGKLYKMDCNTCRCAADNNLVCTKMACLSPAAVSEFKNSWKWKSIQKNLGSVNKDIQIKNKEALRKGGKRNIKISHRQKEPASGKCRPGKIYKKLCEKCFCTTEKEIICVRGKKCNKNNSLRSHIKNEDVAQLEKYIPAVHRVLHIGADCEPGKLYKVDCNKCWCSEKRELSACSRKYCFVSALEESKRLSGRYCHKNINRNCVHCNCTRNITKCELNPNCGFGPIEGSLEKNGSAGNDQLALDTEMNKCIPNNTYSMHCNRCHCLDDGNLVCTSIICLTKSQVKVLENKIAKHGV